MTAHLPKSSVAKCHEAERGTWWVNLPIDGRGSPTVSVKCPLCGKCAVLNHSIAADGNVSPSVVCPFRPCTWHVFALLVGWQDVPRAS